MLKKTILAAPLILITSSAFANADFGLTQTVRTLSGIGGEFGCQESSTEAVKDAQNQLQREVDWLSKPSAIVWGNRASAFEVKSLTVTQPTLQIVSAPRWQGESAPICYKAFTTVVVTTDYYVCKNVHYLTDGRRHATCPSGAWTDR